MKHVMAILKHTIGEEPTISDYFRIGKYDETKRRGIIVKKLDDTKILANSHHMKNYPASYRAFISRGSTHKERIRERNLLKKLAISLKMEQNGRISKFITSNSMLMDMNNRQIYDNQHTAV